MSDSPHLGPGNPTTTCALGEKIGKKSDVFPRAPAPPKTAMSDEFAGVPARLKLTKKRGKLGI